MEPLEAHLEKLLGLSELPHLVRIPNAVPQLQGFQEHQAQQGFNPFQGIDPSLMGNPSTSQPLQSIVSSPIAALTPDSSALSFPSQSIADPPSSQSLLSDYYRLLYRFAAVLPHPHHIEVIASALPSSSPLFLALQCIVPVIKERNTEQSGDEEKKARIRHASLHYAKKAYSAIDEVLENVENQQGKGDYSILEVIQALCILVIYEVSVKSSRSVLYLIRPSMEAAEHLNHDLKWMQRSRLQCPKDSTVFPLEMRSMERILLQGILPAIISA